MARVPYSSYHYCLVEINIHQMRAFCRMEFFTCREIGKFIMFTHFIGPQVVICFSLASFFFFFNIHMLRENDWNYS